MASRRAKRARSTRPGAGKRPATLSSPKAAEIVSLVEELSSGLGARHGAPSVVGAPITRGEVGEALVEHRKETVPHRGVETQRTGVREPGAGLPGRLEERFQVGYVVRNPRKDRRDDQADTDTRVG